MEQAEKKPRGPIMSEASMITKEDRGWINSISQLGMIHLSVREIFGHYGIPIARSEDFDRTILEGFPGANISPVLGLSIEAREIRDFLDYVDLRLEPAVILEAFPKDYKKRVDKAFAG